MVDLDVAYTPVLLYAGGQYGRDDVELIPYGFLANEDDLPEKFSTMVRSSTFSTGEVLTRDEVKIMRARWLLARDAHHKPQMDAWCESMNRRGQHQS